MKRIIQTVALTFIVPFSMQAQSASGSVEIGPGYANQAYYSLQNDEVGQVDKTQWDLAFEASGFGSGIRSNGANDVKVWRYPNADNSEFGTALDTNGLYTWPQLVDSDTSWSLGAFNQSQNFNDGFDLGWGTYNQITHAVTGDSLFIIELPGDEFRQLDIIQLMGGKFEFRFADLDGNNVVEDEVVKGDYSGKNFGYYSILDEEARDLEPTTNDSWDLLFTSYVTMLSPTMPYGVTGVLTNAGVEVAQVDDVDQETYADFNSHTFSHYINEIGWDWKSFNMQSFAFDLEEERVFFIKSIDEEIYKLYFTDFGGSSTGNFEFELEALSTASITDINQEKSVFSVYPNPSNGNDVTLVYEIPTTYNDFHITITDYTGKIAFEQVENNNGGFTQLNLNGLNLNKGGYIASIHFGNEIVRQKLIVQ